MILVDCPTRYPEAVPLKNIETKTVAEALRDMYSRLGIPEEVLSDLGTQFVSKYMEEVSKLLSMKRLTTMPYHPICNGLVKRFNGTLKKMLRCLCNEQPHRWHRFVNLLLFAYREAPQEATGFSPFELLYGRTWTSTWTSSNLKGAVDRRDRWDRNQDELPVCFRIARTLGQHHEDCTGGVAKESEEEQNTI